MPQIPDTPQTGQPAPGARRYSHPLVITQPTYLKARVWQTDTWSPLAQASFHLEQPISGLSLTEIMYNPPGGDDYEFIELLNRGNSPLDISHLSFTGIQYTFPPGSVIEAEEIIVLASDADAFSDRYPQVNLNGVYEGKLSNKGETLSLEDVLGQTIISIPYDDENGWPLSPDGNGDSLNLNNWQADPGLPTTWAASQSILGSPGSHTWPQE